MTTRSPIGIDLGSHSIKAAQTGGDGRPFAYADIPRLEPGTPIGEDDFVRLRGVLYRRGFSGSRVVLGAPKPIIQRLTIDLPPLDSGAPIDEIARSELCRQRGLVPGSFEYCWHETPQPPRHASGARAVTEICTHEHANTLLDLAEARGFSPIGLHSASTMCASLASRLNPQGTVAAVDLGWTDTTFVTVRAGRIRFIRSVASAGLAAMVGAEAWLGTTLGSAIRDIRRSGDAASLIGPEFASLTKRYRATVEAEFTSSIEYLAGCGTAERPSSLVITGGGAFIPGLRDDLAGLVDGETHTPESSVDIGGAIASTLALYEKRPETPGASGLGFGPAAPAATGEDAA